MNGKGDTPRPFSVSIDVYKNNFDRIFAKDTVELCEYSGLPSTHSYDDTATREGKGHDSQR